MPEIQRASLEARRGRRCWWPPEREARREGTRGGQSSFVTVCPFVFLNTELHECAVF